MEQIPTGAVFDHFQRCWGTKPNGMPSLGEPGIPPFSKMTSAVLCKYKRELTLDEPSFENVKWL